MRLKWKKETKNETIETTGNAKILKVFSRTKERQIIGGKVLKGRMVLDKIVKIMRREFEIGRGKIVNLEKAKAKVKEVEEGAEFGMMIESKIEIAEGDIIESFNIIQKINLTNSVCKDVNNDTEKRKGSKLFKRTSRSIFGT